MLQSVYMLYLNSSLKLYTNLVVKCLMWNLSKMECRRLWVSDTFLRTRLDFLKKHLIICVFGSWYVLRQGRAPCILRKLHYQNRMIFHYYCYIVYLHEHHLILKKKKKDKDKKKMILFLHAHLRLCVFWRKWAFIAPSSTKYLLQNKNKINLIRFFTKLYDVYCETLEIDSSYNLCITKI